MEIDLAVLRLMEREREIPFDELLRIIEAAVLTAYLKHTEQPEHPAPGTPRPRVHIDRKTGRVTVLVPELDENGE